jgi:hypothetical protein
MDFEDALFVVATMLIGVGVGCYSAPAGAIAVGLMLAIPPVLSMLRSGAGADKKDGDK